MPTKDGKLVCISIAGGGMRGIIPAHFLEFIEEYTGKPIWHLADMVCGTSVGGLLTGALTCQKPLTAKECTSILLSRGKEIFPQSAWRKFKTLGGNVGPKYDGQGLANVCQSVMGRMELEGALVPTFMTAYAIERRAPIFFKSWVRGPTPTPLKDVAMATSAGPTFFPPAQVNGEWYWDGGVINNNPALSGVIETCMRYGVHTRDVIVIALGTGVSQEPIDHRKAAGWGNLGAVQPLISVTMDGVSDLTHYQMQDLMPDAQYLYLQPKLPAELAPMDDPSPATMAGLLHAAQGVLDLNRGRLVALLDQL